MGIIGRSGLAVLGLLLATPVVHAARCRDTSLFGAAMETVEAAVPCGQATKRRKYVKDAKRAVPRTLSKACRKAFTKRFIVNSTCGHPEGRFVVCCDANRKGKDISKVKKARKCKADPCNNGATNVGEGCTSTGVCVTTTTTSTSTTVTTTSSTTTTTCVAGQGANFDLDFVLGAPVGACGDTRDGSGAILSELTCGGLSIGGGQSVVTEGPTPDGSASRFAANCCGSDCQIRSTSVRPGGNSDDPDCTDTGCNFGTPLPIPNPAIPNLTTCVLNTWSAPASGTLDLATGTSSTNVPLLSDVYLTGNLAQPCPRCSVSGSPDSPGTGTCDRGPRAGQACTTTSSTGLTRDCPTGGIGSASTPCPGGPGNQMCPADNCPCGAGGNCCDGAQVGVIMVDLSPLTTGTASKTNPDGLFCPDMTATQVGCFGSQACRTITENGTPAGLITPGTPTNATLASVFCIAATGNGLVDSSANLPGPGAVSLPGQFTLSTTVTTSPPSSPTSTTIATTTTTAPPSTVTTTTSTTSTTSPPLPTCGDGGGVLDPGEECDPGSPDGAMLVGGVPCPDPDDICNPSTCQCELDTSTLTTLEFANGTPGGACGTTRNGSGDVIKDLTCGGLNIGGGQSVVPEGPTPDGSVSRFAIDCTGLNCNIGPTSTVPPVNTAGPDCTNTGCNFGTPLPIPNPLLQVLTTCVLNTWAAPASGTLNLATGTSTTSVPLASDIYLTGNLAQACPVCSGTGSPASPGTGTCDRGSRAGMACTSTNSDGLTRDCPTGGSAPTGCGASGTDPCPCGAGGGLCVDGSHVGVISVNLSPLTTGTASATNAGGLFCPGQGAAQVGCFGSKACRTITENGVPAGPITPGTPATATLASVFCISATGNGSVDATANLPGPGAVSLPGTFVVN